MQDSYSIGDFLACTYIYRWVLGKVRKLPNAKGEYTLSLLTGPSTVAKQFHFPKEQNCVCISKDNILAKTPAPTAVHPTKRSTSYVLPDIVLDEVNAMFLNK